MSEPGVAIRPGTAADVPAVLPMVRKLCDLHAKADPQRFAVRDDVLDRYARWLPERATDPRSVFLVAERAEPSVPPCPTGRLVGFTVCTIEPEVPIFWVPECGWIHDVWIEPAFRRGGVAQRLVEEVARRFEAMGVKQLRLHTGVFNEAARRAFARAGFRPSVVEMLRPLGPDGA